METNNCISCGKNFHSLRKPVKKSSISAKLVRIDRTVKNVVEQDLGVHFTPQTRKTKDSYISHAYGPFRIMLNPTKPAMKPW